MFHFWRPKKLGRDFIWNEPKNLKSRYMKRNATYLPIAVFSDGFDLNHPAESNDCCCWNTQFQETNYSKHRPNRFDAFCFYKNFQQ